ncbi:gp 124.1 [Bacillus phage W.Ph.]|uniref:Gp 124.1 n=1 Tax=Bacillus phage W.Ph. TaxID=764595 RepID=L7V0W6_9CAUD|nr:gp 124.1 [Bacillus phage W.Ph.]AGC55705.1 gp 124.1 [Bacillus phage W.Ph.]
MFKDEEDLKVVEFQLEAAKAMLQCMLIVLVGFPLGFVLLILLLIFTS